MIQKLIDEINVALDNKLYLVALTAALTLPDVCGKAEYPNDKTGERYKRWYSTFVHDGNIPAEHVYDLRCNLLHEGNTEVDSRNNIHFVLKTNDFTHPLGIDFCFNTDITHADGTHEKKIDVYVGYLCTAICKAAQEYFQANEEKFNLLKYEIQDYASLFEV